MENLNNATPGHPMPSPARSAYEELVLYRLDQLEQKQNKLLDAQTADSKKIDALAAEINTFKGSAKYAGAFAGFVVTILGFIFDHLRLRN